MQVPREKYCETIEFIKKVAEFLKKNLAKKEWYLNYSHWNIWYNQ